MATRNRYGFDRNNRLMDVTGPDGEDNTIVVTGRRPIMEAMTIDQGLMTRPDPVFTGQLMNGPVSETGQFRANEAWNPRQVGSMPGGERRAATRFGAYRLMDADQRLMDGGYGGIQINDGEFEATDAGRNRSVRTLMPEGYAPIMSRDGRLTMSPQAVGALGARQLMEGGQRDPMMGPAIGARELGNRLSVRKQLQAQADQGFVKPGTDATNRAQMRGTLMDANADWLERNKPRLMMERNNTASQIMAGAEASQVTPQIMTQDGVMAGYDPKRREIVSDASGAKAIAQGRIQEAQIAADAKYRGEQKAMNFQEMGINELTTSFNDTIKSTNLSPAEQDAMKMDLLMAKTPQQIAEVNAKYKNPMKQNAMVVLKLQMDEIEKRHAQSSAQGKKTLGGMQAR